MNFMNEIEALYEEADFLSDGMCWDDPDIPEGNAARIAEIRERIAELKKEGK